MLACEDDRENLAKNWNTLLKKWDYDEDCDNLILSWNKYDSWVEGGMIEVFLDELKKKDIKDYEKEYSRACKELYEKGFYVKQISTIKENEDGFWVACDAVRGYDDED